MNRAHLIALGRDCRGNAAAELALIVPLLMVVSFGCLELGNLFLSEHALTTAVRDGARYAARRSFIDYASCAVASDVESKTRRLTRTGQIAAAGVDGRLVGWDEADEASTIDVTVACDTASTYSNAGIYKGNAAGAPVVTVTATVPYWPILGSVGFNVDSRNLYAQSQAAVSGI